MTRLTRRYEQIHEYTQLLITEHKRFGLDRFLDSDLQEASVG